MRLNKPRSSYGKTWSYRLAMFRNMTTSLFKHGRIETTVPKAKELRKFAERMITFGKSGTNNDRIQAAKILRETKTMLPKVFDELAPRYQDRNGGYTRIVKMGWRKIDRAPMAIVELVGGEQDLRYQSTIRTL
ncbi:LSU ribosomal protein L17P, partial [Dimargaris cristalligena]